MPSRSPWRFLSPLSTAAPPAPGAVWGAVPASQLPALCTALRDPPADPGWFSEVKLDGTRFLVRKHRAGIGLVARNGVDRAAELPAIAAWFAGLAVDEAVLDGELVAPGPGGGTSYQALDRALAAGDHAGLAFYAFDLLALDGWDLRGCSLRDRKAILLDLDPWHGPLRYSEHVEGEPAELYRHATAHGLEGIVCKRNLPYHEGRNGDWVKVKALAREELVVLGWNAPHGSCEGIAALHLGYYDPAGRLHYAGAVASGLSRTVAADWHARLQPLAALPGTMLVAGEPVDARWVKPRHVVEISFTAWSDTGRVREPVYLGIRHDKPPRAVVRPVAAPAAPRVVFALRPPPGRQARR